MKYSLLLAICIATLLSGCARTSPLHEAEDLVTIAHNKVTDYTLLVYRNEDGSTRQVLRRKGVCEMTLIETHAGEFILKERGEASRKLNETMVEAVQSHLHDLIYAPIAEQRLNGPEVVL